MKKITAINTTLLTDIMIRTIEIQEVIDSRKIKKFFR